MSEWIDGVAAVLEGYMMGQAGGEAIADILFGKVNPCGKLAETFPLKLADIPTLINWPGESGKVRYGEGLYIGYRYYDVKNLPVLFPFGFGLSYTTFAYYNPKVSASSFTDVDGVTVSIDVTNTGKMAGKEIVQVYVHDQASALSRPQKELKGFAKVSLQPGETKTVSVKLDFRAFAYYHPLYQKWVAEEGAFDILIGASAADIRHRVTVNLQSTQSLPCLLNKESTLNEWKADRRGNVVLAPIYDQIETAVYKLFGGQERYGSQKKEDSLELGGDIMDMMNDMPLVSVLMFQRKSLPIEPEEMVEGLLQQAHSLEK
jgi:beta-glucosidase